MKKNIQNALDSWPNSFIKDTDLAKIIEKSDDARYSFVKRALKANKLIRIRKGLYLIDSKTQQKLPDEFELATLIYQPSIISLESALSYHGLIPEAVYTTTCVSPKRAQEFKTPIGIFKYTRVPTQDFYCEVKRIKTETGVIFIAEPWRALADLIYTKRKSWENLEQLEADLRINDEALINLDIKSIELLSQNYPSPRVRKQLKIFLKEIIKKR